MNSEKKTIAALEAGSFSMPERQWAGLERVAARKVFEDLSKPTRRTLGTMIGLDKRTIEALQNRGLIKGTAYRLGDTAYEDFTTTELGCRALATRGISYPVRYPEIGDVERVPYHLLAAWVLRERADDERRE